MVEGINGVVRFLHSLEGVGDVVVDRQLHKKNNNNNSKGRRNTMPATSEQGMAKRTEGPARSGALFYKTTKTRRAGRAFTF